MAGPPPGRPRDPFGPPLDGAELREVFRRLAARPWAEQEAFVARLNWNLLDPAAEAHLMGWLAASLLAADGPRQGSALRTLDKLPHPKRARHTARFEALLPHLDEDMQARLRAAFGPVLGGPRKKPAKPGGAPPPPPAAASADDLAKLRDFFGKR